MAKEADIANNGAIPKVLRQQHPPPFIITGDRTSGPLSTKRIPTKRVTFNEIPIICEMSNEFISTANNVSQKRFPKLPQPVPKTATNTALLHFVPAANKGLVGVEMKKSHLKPPPVRKTSRTRKVSYPVPMTTSNVASGERNADTVTIADNAYSRPEMHSSLHIAKMLQAVQLETFDADRAVKEKLKTCRTMKRQLDERSSRPVNIPTDEIVFHDVVPLEFDEEALLTAAAEVKEAKMKLLLPVARRRDPQPDIEEFLTDDMQPEFVAIPEPDFHFPHLKMPAKAPLSSAYHLYKHKRMWEGLP